MSVLDKFILAVPKPQPDPATLPEPEAAIRHFRHWWWNEFDTGADDAEFDEGSPEAAQDLLPILRGLTWPDFEVWADGTALKLWRVTVRHYPSVIGPLALQERVGDSEQFQRVVVGTPTLTEKDAYPGSLFEQ